MLKKDAVADGADDIEHRKRGCDTCHIAFLIESTNMNLGNKIRPSILCQESLRTSKYLIICVTSHIGGQLQIWLSDYLNGPVRRMMSLIVSRHIMPYKFK